METELLMLFVLKLVLTPTLHNCIRHLLYRIGANPWLSEAHATFALIPHYYRRILFSTGTRAFPL